MNGTSGVRFSSEELSKALLDVEDLMDRLLTPYVLLGKTAECVKNDRLLDTEAIEVGIKKTDITQYVRDVIRTYLNVELNNIENGFEYKAGAVPVKVKVYTRNYTFFKYPDTKVYSFGTYLIPNPFEVYWKVRGLIR